MERTDLPLDVRLVHQIEGPVSYWDPNGVQSSSLDELEVFLCDVCRDQKRDKRKKDQLLDS